MQQTPSTATPSETTRFGVLGTGRITRRLVAELQQSAGVRVTAIASRDAARARWYADQFGIPQAHGGYAALLASSQVDAVYIALPPALHAEWCEAAARSGKHVLCEKPWVTCAADARRLDALCTAQGVHWLDATAWLHHARTAAMSQEIDAGTLGTRRHVSASVSFFQPFHSGDHRLDPQLGGGCLLDLGWYACGAAVWACGGVAPRRVMAMGHQQQDIWQRVSAVCEFGDGTTASVNCAYDIATRKWMEIAADAASLVCDDFTRPWTEKPPRYWIHDRAGAVSTKAVEGAQECQMIATFVAALGGRIDLAPLRRQAIATQLMLDALATSALQQRPVSLELGSDPP